MPILKINVKSNNLANFYQKTGDKSEILKDLYLYHITSESCYQLILKDKKIKLGGKWDFIMGVYLIEFSNLIKCGKCLKLTDFDFRKMLLHQSAKGNKKIVALKIPASNLDNKEELLIRSLNELSAANYKENFKKALNKWLKTKKIPKGEFEHLFTGKNVSEAVDFLKKENAIEYIYPYEIPISKIRKIGEANFNPKNPNIKEVYEELLKNTSEAKFLEYF